jgi:gliding motility-associated-like protein
MTWKGCPSLVLLVVLQVPVHAQKEANNWVFGGFGGANFSCTSPEIFFTPFDGLEGGASISSPNGELLFFTNGDVVWNKDFRVMPNGRNLGGLCTNYANFSSSSQSSLIVPHPGIPHQYYIFTTDCAEDGFVAGLRYSIVDLSLNGGLGDVIEKDKPLVGLVAEKIAAVFQPNGRDVWVVTHGVLSNSFFAFSISDSGLNVVPVISNTGQVHPGGRGYLKFSPDGQRLVATSFVGSSNDGILPELFTFNRITGAVTSDFILPTSSKSIYGASFSPNSKLLYTTCAWTCSEVNRVIDQFNLEAGTPQEIVDQKFTIPTPGLYGALQLGIDGQLYYLSFEQNNNGITNYLSVISFPNLPGASCKPIQQYVPLPCWIGPSWGLPNFIESYFQSPVLGSPFCNPIKKDIIDNFDFSATVNCENLSVNIDNQSSIRGVDIVTGGGVLPLTWTVDFGDGTTGTSNQPEDWAHTYAKAGTYTVTLTVRKSNCHIRSIQKVVKVLPVKAQFNYAQDCQSFSVNFINTTTESGEPIEWTWNFGDNGLQTNLKNPSYTYASAGSYKVSLVAKSICNTSATELIIQLLNPLTVSLGPDADFCFGESFSLGMSQPSATYLWNNQSTEASISVTTPGQYSVELSRGNCSVSDTINLSYRDCLLCNDYLNYVDKLDVGNDTTICETDALRISIDDSILWEMLWSNGSSDRSIEVTSSGLYWVSITGGNCTASDTVNVTTRDCTQCDVFVPNVFTPNGDKINDEFSLIFGCEFYDFKMSIFNRWGQLLLTSQSTSWNGLIGNESVSTGAYYFVIQYSIIGPGASKLAQDKKGWVQVIK